DNLVPTGYTFASTKNKKVLMRNFMKVSFAVIPVFVIIVGLPAVMLAQADTRYDLLLKGGHVIDPANHIDEVRDVGVLQGKIAAVEKNIPADQGRKAVDV